MLEAGNGVSDWSEFFTFGDAAALASQGWATPQAAGERAFTRRWGRTPSWGTGPLTGVGGSGYYYHAETSGQYYQPFSLSFDGSMCTAGGQVIASVSFRYHMWGGTMGTLRVVDSLGKTVWSLSGNQGNAWQSATVALSTPSFAFKYMSGRSYTGDAAIAEVEVHCSHPDFSDTALRVSLTCSNRAGLTAVTMAEEPLEVANVDNRPPKAGLLSASLPAMHPSPSSNTTWHGAPNASVSLGRSTFAPKIENRHEFPFVCSHLWARDSPYKAMRICSSRGGRQGRSQRLGIARGTAAHP